MVLVRPPRAAIANGTFETTFTGAPPVLSTIPTSTRGMNRTDDTKTTVPSHLQPWSFSGAKT
jgi:hypothetical protein